jgi:adenine-specific DNA-methyltransferase
MNRIGGNTQMTEIQAKLNTELKNLFQFDQSDLDFGVYRIMAMKRAEIENFLSESLPAQILEGLQELASLDNRSDIAAIDENIAQMKASPLSDAIKKTAVEELQQKKAELSDKHINVSDIERDIYNHLCEFFSRYYDEGDFISQRRYKEDVYAIPYEGEEVKLHWANADQYYVKTSENFRDYTFNNGSGKVCHFKLVDAETEKDNNKSKAKRLFQLCAENPFALEGDNLTIYLEYKSGDKKQEEYIKGIIEALGNAGNALSSASWVLNLGNDKSKTILERQLIRYTAKNTFDYFIHKNLSGFLNRELDFFIKSEVFYIDDIDEQSFAHTRVYVTKAKVLRMIARKIIAFLAQIENFQKKLYLKKKFVVETNYCITLDRVPEAFYDEITANDAQREEWVKLFAIDVTRPGYSAPLTIDFLKSNPFLVLGHSIFQRGFQRAFNRKH